MIKKLGTISSKKRKRLLGTILGASFLLILVFTPFKGVLASNNFIDNISFFRNNLDGYNHLSFFCKTSFTYEATSGWWFAQAYLDSNLKYAFYYCPFPKNFLAGESYDFILYNGSNCSTPSDFNFTSDYYLLFNSSNASEPFSPQWTDSEKYYFTEYPTLTITYPSENYTIAGAFSVQADFTTPSNSTYNLIGFDFLNNSTTSPVVYSYYKAISEGSSGSVSVPVSNLPAGNYNLGGKLCSNNTNTCTNYLSALTNITIAETIPYQLPETNETIPLIYQPLNAQEQYPRFSNYATSTKLYNALAGATSPVLQAIGNNLNNFSGRFKTAEAVETGTGIGNAVLTARAYSNNLNAFFNNIPVSRFFFLYLIVLLAVVIFRLIKALIGLFKI